MDYKLDKIFSKRLICVADIMFLDMYGVDYYNVGNIYVIATYEGEEYKLWFK